MTESVFSKKITWFSFVFSLMVIWVHSYNAELYLSGTDWMEPIGKFEYRIINWLAQIAVPGFFMISGYLFYRRFDMSMLRSKWESRIRSVLVPYIVWNFLYYMGYVIGSRLPWMGEVVGKGVIPFELHVAVDAVVNHTYNYVFWYLYQLILLICLAPVLYRILVELWSRVIFFIILIMLLYADVRLPFLNVDALFYYAAAASLALTKRKFIEQDEPGEMVWRVGIILVFAGIISYELGLQHAKPIGFVLCRFFAVAGLWMAVSGSKLPEVKNCMTHNFFLYATHFGMVRFINKAFAKMFEGALVGVPVVPVLLFLLMPGMTLLISMAAARLMRRMTPRMWNLLNGGR